MADTHVIHEERPTASSDNGMGFLLGVIILIAFLFFLFYYGIPALRGSQGNPQINVPSKIDVNYQQK